MKLFRFIRVTFLSALLLLAHATLRAGVPLPKVPSDLVTPASRAAFIVEHFWDAAAWPQAAEDPDFEQDFVNWISLFPLAKTDTVGPGPAVSLQRFVEKVAQRAPVPLSQLAEKYLYDLESPMADEETYLLFLDAFIKVGMDEQGRFAYQRETILNNRVGSRVAAFAYKGKDGKQHVFKGGAALLLFYDPDCEHCKQLVERLERLSEGGIYVDEELREFPILAIALNADEKSFKASMDDFIPGSWNAGWDSTGRINGVDFAIRKLPDVYLIGENGAVIAKHVRL